MSVGRANHARGGLVFRAPGSPYNGAMPNTPRISSCRQPPRGLLILAAVAGLLVPAPLLLAAPATPATAGDAGTAAAADQATLTASEIVARTHAAAGGAAWLRAGSNIMRGHATLCRDGRPEACVTADRYEMYRIYPTDLRQAHAGSGKFRLDAWVGDRLLFQTAFDGERSYDQNGPVSGARAASDEGSGFGFSAIRFALAEGFRVERMLDDQVEGHPCYIVRVTDPAGQTTTFGIARADYSIRSAAWLSPRGWHQRLYSDFYRVGPGGFLQPGRVRHYYEGVKSIDIRWTSAEIGTPIADEVFVLGPRRAATP